MIEPLEVAGPLSAQDQVNAVIASLAMPDDVAAAKQWANEKNFQQNTHGVTAYAKVSGANWTYYVKDLVIKIGRPPDNRPNTSGSPTPPPMQKHEDMVKIDLGPNKSVSRSHAVISYDTNGEHNWQIYVTGRNGVKVDDETFKKESKTVLRSGSVIEIGGVQMMFVLPNKMPVIASSILRRARIHQYMVDEEAPAMRTDDTSYDHSSQVARPTSALAGDSISRPDSRADTGATTLGFHRGLMLESTEDVDYSDDSMKEVKPPFSYALLIAQAILSCESEQLTLASIYQFIQDKYAFYRHSNMGWQNSIRHNLSLNKAFRKIPRRTDEPGKGMKWELLPEHREEYIKKLQKPPKGNGRQGSSQPGSPSPPRPAPKALPQQPVRPIPSLASMPDLSYNYPVRAGTPRSVTPPPAALSSYRVQPLEAYTPDRGSHLPALRNADKTLSDTPGIKLRNQSGIQSGGVISSSQAAAPPSPSQQPSLYGGGDDNPAVVLAVTPAPQRQHPRLAPPSTNQLPSSYLPTSSPAPFWKYVQFGSTPAKPNDYSPSKDLTSSSPPPQIDTNNQSRELGSPLKDRSGGFHLGGPRTLISSAKADEQEDDEGLGDFPGIDLTRGFEKIGKFHMNGRFAESDGWTT